MAIYYRPPPAFIGGRQPYAPHGPFPSTSTTVSYSLSLGVTTSQASPFSSEFSSDFGPSPIGLVKTVSTRLGSLNAEGLIVRRLISRLATTLSGQSSSVRRLVGTVRPAENAESTTVIRLASHISGLATTSGQIISRRLAVSIIRAALDAQAVARGVAASIARRASSGQTAARVLLVSIARSALDAQQVGPVVAAGLYARLLGAGSALVPSLQKLAGALRATTGAQATGRRVAVSIARTASDAQAAAVGRGNSLIRTAVDAQTAARKVLVSIARSVLDPEVAALGQAAVRSKVLSAINAQVAALVALYIHAGINTGQVLAAFQAQVTSIIKTAGLPRSVASGRATAFSRLVAGIRIFSIASVQTVRLQRLTSFTSRAVDAQATVRRLVVSAGRGAASAESTTRVSGLSLSSLVGASSVQVTSLRRGMAALRPTISNQVLSLVRLVSVVRRTAAVQVSAHSVAAFKRLATASSEAVALIPLRAFLRACSAVSTQALALTRVGLHTIARGIAGASSARLVRSAATLLATLSAQAPARFAATGKRLAITAGSMTAAAPIGNRIRIFAVQQARSVSAITAFIHSGVFFVVGSVSSASAATLSKTIGKAFMVAAPTVTVILSWYFKFVPIGQRRRVVRLPEPQQFTVLPPCARRIMLPLEASDMSDYQIRFPEPPFFSPLDPTDTDLFTFDWSIRGYPNDTIVSASVVSIPSGVNFLGPAFISGPSVTVTVGPFAIVPPLPATYSLRCMVIFGSGRISNYSVPFIVKAL